MPEGSTAPLAFPILFLISKNVNIAKREALDRFWCFRLRWGALGIQAGEQAQPALPPYLGNMSESHHHHHHASEVPVEQRLAAHVHAYPRCVVPLCARAHRLAANAQRSVDSWLAHQAKEALNFQYTLTGAFCVSRWSGWAAPRPAFWLFAIVLAFDWLFSLIAAVRSAFGERYVYPVKLTIIR